MHSLTKSNNYLAFIKKGQKMPTNGKILPNQEEYREGHDF